MSLIRVEQLFSQSETIRDCHQIHLASAKMLPTTSSRLAIIKCEHVIAVIAAAATPECFGQFTPVKAENCDKEKTRRCGALPLRRPGA